MAFFGFISELKNPKEFPKALALLQVCDITMYIVSAVVIYCYGGIGVASPALGAAGHVVKKIAYGIAIPTVRCLHSQYLTFLLKQLHRSSLPVLYMDTSRRSIFTSESLAQMN